MKRTEELKINQQIFVPLMLIWLYFRIEKSASGNSFSVVPIVTSPPQRPRGPANVLSVEKPLKENIQFKKRKSEKADEKVCDVLGEIMSQMKKAKKE